MTYACVSMSGFFVCVHFGDSWSAVGRSMTLHILQSEFTWIFWKQSFKGSLSAHTLPAAGHKRGWMRQAPRLTRPGSQQPPHPLLTRLVTGSIWRWHRKRRRRVLSSHKDVGVAASARRPLGCGQGGTPPPVVAALGPRPLKQARLQVQQWPELQTTMGRTH